MKVSVVIPAYNEEKYIGSCLEALLQQDEKADEIIVVNNNCTDKTAAIAKTYGVRLVSEKTQGMIYSRNRGFNSAKYQLILRTDADTKVPKDWIKRIKKHFTDKNIIGVSGPSRFYGAPRLMKVRDWPTKVFFKTFQQILQHDCLFGPNMALRKSAWEKVKNDVCLDDSAVHEDIDLSIHLAQYGELKFDPKLVVNSSFRRWKRIAPYFDYPYRAIRTIQRHNMSLSGLKRSKALVSNEFLKKLLKSRTKRLKKLVSTTTKQFKTL